MKRIALILTLIALVTSLAANVNQAPITQIQTEPQMQPMPSHNFDTYSYGKVGASLLFQNIGYGWRTRNLAEKWGTDTSLNSNICIPSLFAKAIIAYPSIKYTSITYKEPTPYSRYFGVGYEVGFIVMYPFVMPFPNLELVWGTERGNNSFSQFGLNVIPAAALITALLTVGKNDGIYGIAKVGAVALSAPMICSYTVSF